MSAEQSTEHSDASGPYGRAAAAYLAAGWHPIPLPPGQKYPPPEGFSGYAGRAVTAAHVEFWCNDAGQGVGNVALRMPPEVLGVDVDHYVKADGTVKLGGDTLAEAEARLGSLPATVRSTAREGDRVSGIRFYRVPPGRRWASELGNGVELIHHGLRYAVAWPSTNPDAGGSSYRWHDDRAGGVVLDVPPSTAELPELPGSWVAHLDRGAVGRRPAKATEVERLEVPGGDPCPYVAGLVDELRAVLAGGGSRHDATRRAVLRVVRAGEQGHRGAPDALDQAEALFLAALRGESSVRRRGAEGEFGRMRIGAVAEVSAAATPEELRGCCGEDSRLAGLSKLWEFDGTDDAAEPSAAAAEPGTGTAAGEPDAEAEFWRSRPFLSAVLRFARARRIGPWALLGAVLARAAACVPPGVVLPATIGSVASLNLFVALCSESGGGKSVAMAAAKDFLDPTGGTADYLETSPGSGEGLLGAYCYVHTEKGKAPEVRQTRLSVLFDIDEVSALAALLTRTSSTLLPFLKSAWSGHTLATQNAEAARQRHVGEHRYRLALVVGVQPANAGPILDDAAGGFPQRFLWLPTYDPGRLAPGEVLLDPLPWRWQVPAAPVQLSGDGATITWPLRREVAVPEVARLAMHRADAERQRPIGSAVAAGGELDGHALLTRAKVAALLALLDGRADAFTEADWTAAGVILAKSDETRRAVMGVRGAAERREADRRATRAGRSAALAADAETETTTLRAMTVIRAGMRRHGGEFSGNAVQKLCGSRYPRPVVTDALDRLTGSGELLAEDRTGANGRTATFYRWPWTAAGHDQQGNGGDAGTVPAAVPLAHPCKPNTFPFLSLPVLCCALLVGPSARPSGDGPRRPRCFGGARRPARCARIGCLEDTSGELSPGHLGARAPGGGRRAERRTDPARAWPHHQLRRTRVREPRSTRPEADR